MANLAASNLTQRKTRSAITIVSVAVEVTLVLILIGLTTGSLNEVGRRIENLDSDIMLLPPGSQPILSFNMAVMPIKGISALLDGVPDIQAYTPVVFGNTSKFGSFGMVFGIQPESYTRACGALDILEGKSFEGPDDLVLDRRLVRAEKLRVGDTVKLFEKSFTLRGICRDGAGVRIYAPIETLQELHGKAEKASCFFIKVKDRRAIESVMGSLGALPPLKGYVLINNRNYLQMLANNAFGLNEFIAAITLVAVIFGFLVILLAMYTTIMERTRQIGILKSLGASRKYIVAVILQEALILCGAGIVLGYALTGVLKYSLERMHPTLTIELTVRWIVISGLLALGGGLLGSLYPAMRAARVDPVQALQYE